MSSKQNQQVIQTYLQTLCNFAYIQDFSITIAHKSIQFVYLLATTQEEMSMNKFVLQFAELILACLEVMEASIQKLNLQQVSLLMFIFSKFEIYQLSHTMYTRIWASLIRLLPSLYPDASLNQKKSFLYSIGKVGFTNAAIEHIYTAELDLPTLAKLAAH